MTTLPGLKHTCGTPPAARQRGVALLALVALLMLVGAGVLIERVNARVEYSPQLSSRTGVVLKQAKAALIARAVIDSNRPGELPCPDVNYDGQLTFTASPPNPDLIGSACTRLLGWLPWRTLDLQDLRDASGARLWYGLSDDWRANNTVPLNPDTPGGLTLNGSVAPDIVAVIIAPGVDLKLDTDPRPAETSTAMDATSQTLVQKFLEDANGDGLDLTAYVNQAGGDFNDRLVIITRAELIAAVQRRVAGELAVALSDYRNTNGRYPWLSINLNPLATVPANPVATDPDPHQFNGQPGVRNGYIAYIDALNSENYTFKSGFTVSWDRGSVNTVSDKVMSANGTITWYVPGADEDTMKDAVKDVLDNASPYTVTMPTIPLNGAECNWQNDAGQVDCEYTKEYTAPYTVSICRREGMSNVCPYQSNVAVKRVVTLKLHYQGAATTSVTNGARTRDVQSPTNGPFQNSPGNNTEISVVDTVDTSSIDPGLNFFASRTLTIDTGDNADFNTTGIYAEPQSGGTLPGDLPAWFAANNWGPYMYVSYAANLIPTESGACTAGIDCLSLSVAGSPSRDDIEAVVVSAGVSLPGTTPSQTRGPGSGLADLFEDSNKNGNDNVERKAGTAIFNDYLRLVACAPGPAADCR